MNVEKLMQAVGVIEEVTNVFQDMPEDQEECILAAIQCQMVGLYLMEFARHLRDGMEPYDACLAVAQGKTLLSDMGVSDSQITLFKLLGGKGHKE
jgi:hypothetical protein